MKEDIKRKSPSKVVERISWTIIAIAAIFFVSSLMALLYPEDLASYALIGDINGGVAGSLWALGGVLLFYAALKSQQSSLEIQNREFELQREELKEARMISSTQTKTMQQQRFENTFFHLLKSHKENLELLKINASNNQITGLFALHHLWKTFKGRYKKGQYLPDLQTITNEFVAYSNEYDHVLNTYKNGVFRTLLLLDALEIEHKHTYMNLYASQITHLEKVILFYSGIHAKRENQLKPLIEKYHLLHLLDEQQLIDSEHWMEYNLCAYQSNIE